MAFGVVFVGLTVFFVSDGLVRSVTKRLVFRKTTHADKNGTLLWLHFEWFGG
jgi:hypothetical protein